MEGGAAALEHDVAGEPTKPDPGQDRPCQRVPEECARLQVRRGQGDLGAGVTARCSAAGVPASMSDGLAPLGATVPPAWANRASTRLTCTGFHSPRPPGVVRYAGGVGAPVWSSSLPAAQWSAPRGNRGF
jgi:hypothetical protein